MWNRKAQVKQLTVIWSHKWTSIHPFSILASWSKGRVTPWTSRKFITVPHRKINNHSLSHTHLRSIKGSQFTSIHMHVLDCGRRLENPGENPRRLTENRQTPHGKVPGRESKPQPSCCEVTVLRQCIKMALKKQTFMVSAEPCDHNGGTWWGFSSAIWTQLFSCVWLLQDTVYSRNVKPVAIIKKWDSMRCCPGSPHYLVSPPWPSISRIRCLLSGSRAQCDSTHCRLSTSQPHELQLQTHFFFLIFCF